MSPRNNDGYYSSFYSSLNSPTSSSWLNYYALQSDKTYDRTTLSRSDFLDQSLRLASYLSHHGCAPSTHVLHLFTSNTLSDLLARYAHAVIGSVGVTTNWSADSKERIEYKARSTGCKVVVMEGRVEGGVEEYLKGKLEGVKFLDLKDKPYMHFPPLPFPPSSTPSPESTRFVIFTSGTTGDPKGVNLTHSNYLTNALTFKGFLNPNDGKFTAVVTNPMHHTNSTSITDWCVRDGNSTLHLFSGYSTKFWTHLDEIVQNTPTNDTVIAPLVSRHIDFLSSLSSSVPSPLPKSIKTSLSRTVILLGSAPVGPSTIRNLQECAGTLPTVRFGSTETTLQVLGTPRGYTNVDVFKAGWDHSFEGNPSPGYYIGRPHDECTSVRVVKSVKGGEEGFMVDVAEGTPGYLVCEGGNVMSGYVNNDKATREVLVEDGGKTWYTNLGDVCFYLAGRDGGKDYYWMSRDSALLIRGGANYSYAQVENELQGIVKEVYGEGIELAVVGLRVESEHEDDCLVTISFDDAVAQAERDNVEKTFMSVMKKKATKGAKPTRMMIGDIPKNFKGAVLVKDLKKIWKNRLIGAVSPPPATSNDDDNRDHYPYCSCYCEENVFKLLETLLKTKPSPDQHYVCFISNDLRATPLWYQRAGGGGGGEPVVWDYHVVCISKPDNSGIVVRDFD
eukprot:CAMPEP_0118633566 /NCGR_PEP_ID=MMETSP0785-20121206/1069_1 /TAXON_ID=91992 /ORGANISM="Bolidomonas pacifica, Strain CCMP 1866" /LENGTH=672 /DNA_ID=CAMNT_0006524457 /DNA_START=73 /DNA_END=2088 /DNA_ORIENTATION=+